MGMLRTRELICLKKANLAAEAGSVIWIIELGEELTDEHRKIISDFFAPPGRHETNQENAFDDLTPPSLAPPYDKTMDDFESFIGTDHKQPHTLDEWKEYFVRMADFYLTKAEDYESQQLMV